MQQKKQIINGFLNIYKETGVSSNQVLGEIKKIIRPKKIGHGGTLDLLAEGVLPVALGEATKTLQFILDSDKEYEFLLEWGYETESFDLESEITQKSDNIPTEADIQKVLKNFTGTIEQIPPAFSALRIDGKRAYELAREGKDVDMSVKRREVNIYSLELLSHENNQTWLRAKVSKGTYIRTLGIDIARSLNSCATIIRLIRTKTKSFDKNSSITLKTLDEEQKKSHNIKDLLLNVDIVLDNIPVFIVSEAEEQVLNNGQVKFELPDIGLFRVYNQSNTLLSVVSNDGDQIKILRNFNL
ncbi:MAG: tRNA pseudouridine(55) synthase TruB [Proteobacteria bacterium]|nr:tRNA pseudouridine(55) synthase TruB [Pseudomonadota bacterium]